MERRHPHHHTPEVIRHHRLLHSASRTALCSRRSRAPAGRPPHPAVPSSQQPALEALPKGVMRRPAPHPLRHPASRHARATSCACGCLALSWDPAGDGITQEDTRGQRSSASTRCGEIGITLPRPVSEMEGSMVSSPRSRSRSSQRRSMVSPTRSPVNWRVAPGSGHPRRWGGPDLVVQQLRPPPWPGAIHGPV